MTSEPKDVLFPLARSVWPRNGCDPANTSQVKVRGPSLGRITRRIGLIASTAPHRPRSSGIAVAEDRSLRVTHGGWLHAVARGGALLWSAQLREVVPAQGEPTGHVAPPHHSCPVALSEGRTLVTLHRRATIFHALGLVSETFVLGDSRLDDPRLVPSASVASWGPDGIYLDDSGLAPSVSHAGALRLTTVDGHIVSPRQGRLRALGNFGYDVPPVAFLADDSMIVAGYEGVGLAHLGATGRLIRRLGVRDADTLPTISRGLTVAVSGGTGSAFFNLHGQQLGAYPRKSLFAEYIEGGWVAQGSCVVARITDRCDVIWEREIDGEEPPTRYQPIVDAEGRVFAAVPGGAVCLDADGTLLWQVTEGTAVPGPLAIVGEGRLGFVLGSELLIIE